MLFGGLDDDRKDSTVPRITLRPQLGGCRQCGLATCTFHLGFSLVASDRTVVRGVPGQGHRVESFRASPGSLTTSLCLTAVVLPHVGQSMDLLPVSMGPMIKGVLRRRQVRRQSSPGRRRRSGWSPSLVSLFPLSAWTGSSFFTEVLHGHAFLVFSSAKFSLQTVMVLAN